MNRRQLFASLIGVAAAPAVGKQSSMAERMRVHAAANRAQRAMMGAIRPITDAEKADLFCVPLRMIIPSKIDEGNTLRLSSYRNPFNQDNGL